MRSSTELGFLAVAHRAATLAGMGIAPVREIKRRRYAGEEEWFALLGELGPSALRRGYIACGVPAQIAGNLVWFLEDQLLLDRTQAETTRGRYRRVLSELDPDEVRRAARAIPGLFNRAAA